MKIRLRHSEYEGVYSVDVERKFLGISYWSFAGAIIGTSLKELEEKAARVVRAKIGENFHEFEV